MLDFAASILGRMPLIVSADKGYGVWRFYSELEKRGITPHVPPQHSKSESRIPISRLLRMKQVNFERAKKYIEKRRGIVGRNRAHRLKHTAGFRISRLLRLRVEHKIGEAKEMHGLRRARHRGIEKVDAQVKITAAVMNLKLLARHLGGRRTPKAVRLASQAVQAFFASFGIEHVFDAIRCRFRFCAVSDGFNTRNISQAF